MNSGSSEIATRPESVKGGRVLKYGFWGAESFGKAPPTTLGNVLLSRMLYDPARILTENRFASYELNRALLHLLENVDVDKDGIVSEDEVHEVKLQLFGYSWGAAIAVALACKLSRPGRLTIWKRGFPVKRYELQAPIPVSFLALVDPVPYMLGLVKRSINLKGFPVLPPQIETFVNFYQTKGGTGTFREDSVPYHPLPGYRSIGTPLSRRLKGSAMTTSEKWGESCLSEQVNITTHRAEECVLASPFSKDVVMRLRGDEVNHDVIPFFAAGFILRRLGGIAESG